MFKTWNVLNPVALVTTQLEKKLKKMGNVKNPLEWERAVKFTIYELIQSEKILQILSFFFLAKLSNLSTNLLFCFDDVKTENEKPELCNTAVNLVKISWSVRCQ